MAVLSCPYLPNPREIAAAASALAGAGQLRMAGSDPRLRAGEGAAGGGSVLALEGGAACAR